MSDANFQTALAALYATFAHPRPSIVTGCPCCIDQKNIGALTSKPLRDLTHGDLAPYASSVFLTVDGDDFRYFLPRIFELSAAVNGWWPSPEVAISKLRRANWNDWPERDRQAVRLFLAAWLDSVLARGADHANDTDSILCGIALSGDDLAPYLARLRDHADLLAAYRDTNASALSQGKLINGFWEESPHAAREVIELLNDIP